MSNQIMINKPKPQESEKKVNPYNYLNADYLTEIYQKLKEEFGNPSLGRLQDYCKRKGIVNPATGLPPTRQGLYLALQRTTKGRLLLAESSHAHYLHRPSNGWIEERWELAKKRAELKVRSA